MNGAKVEPVRKIVSVKLVLNEGVSVEDFKRLKENEGTGADLKYLLDWDFHPDSLERKIVSFGEYGEVDDGDADWVVEELDKVCECRIGRIAEESDGGCSLELVLVDRIATRAKQRASDGAVLSDDGLELRSVPCDIVEFKFPASVKKIADYAFHESKELATIEIPGHVETIGMLAFGRCAKLKKVVIQSGCKHIGRAAFADCEELREVLLPDTVKEIEPLAFSGDKKLVKVRMPGNLSEFGFGVFEGCPALLNKMVVSGDGT